MMRGRKLKNSKIFQDITGFQLEEIDSEKLKDLVVNSFIYHEKMADVSISTINQNDKNGIPVAHKSALWQSFETNNTIAFALRDVIYKAANKNTQ